MGPSQGASERERERKEKEKTKLAPPTHSPLNRIHKAAETVAGGGGGKKDVLAKQNSPSRTIPH